MTVFIICLSSYISFLIGQCCNRTWSFKCCFLRSRKDNPAGIVSGLLEEDRRFYWHSRKEVPATNALRQALESSQPLIRWTPWPPSLAVHLLGCQADHKSLSCTEFSNERVCVSTPPIAFMGCSGSTVLLLLRCYVTFVPENERQSFTVLGTILDG
jgi:hypothetical protein